MPMPIPQPGEDEDQFMTRCLGDAEMLQEFADDPQRAAVCRRQWTGDVIEARLMENLPVLLQSPGIVPNDIQWMPPGEHTITAIKNGKPVTVEVRVGKATAELLQRQLEKYLEAARAGRGDYPYLDLNHEDGPAAAHVTQFYWGGDDAFTGGVRARVVWTTPGSEAVIGRAYRRFSPSFRLNADGEVVEVPINMGGLVNRAAFENIQAIWSRQAASPNDGQVNQQKGIQMDPTKELADLRAANEKLETQVSELQAKLAKAESAELIAAKDAEIDALKGQIKDLTEQILTQAKANAKTVVDAAIKAGKLAPQNTALHAKWITAIAADPDLAETLTAMAPNPALRPVVNGTSAGDQTPNPDPIQAFEDEVASLVNAGKPAGAAWTQAIQEKPEMYTAWRKAKSSAR